jgi:phosphatidate cytidylyltransferase
VKKKFNDLAIRILISFFIIAILGGLLIFANLPLVQMIITLIVIVFGAIGIWEFAQFCRNKKLNVSSQLMVLFGGLEITAIYLNGLFSWAYEWPFGVLLLAIFVFGLQKFKEINDSIPSIAVQFFALCYIAVPLGLMLKILYPSLSCDFEIRDGRIWFIYLIAITKITDIGAYFGGKLLGKHKLCPKLSPGKTIEGAISGLIFSVIASVLFSYFGYAIPDSLFKLPVLNSIFLGGAISVAGQFGDLSESLLKRDAGVKDSNILPGFGGVLDLFDSLLFSTPVLFFYLNSPF